MIATSSGGTQVVGGRYEIIKWIGAGGMQNVYRARDTLFQRDVALKTPKDSSSSKRFRRSAVLSAKVNHANVAKTLDYLEEGETLYLIEELVEGDDLSRLLPDLIPVIPPSACARILHQLARGLCASHHAGVVHRDLKPSNIMIVGGTKFAQVKITDFGIAKMAEAEIGEWAGQGKGGTTSSKTVLGAIPYMAPESVTDFSAASAPSDIWAIAAITYQLLSGSMPFGSGLMSIPAILQATPPTKPNTIAGPQFRELGEELFTIILKCLNGDPNARPTAEQLVNTMEPLCYSVDEYELGTISRVNNNYWGFISADVGGDAMYHVESFYGGSAPKLGDRVWFARHPGSGSDRAFPLVKLRQT